MTSNIPPALKAVKTFLVRAIEIDKSKHPFADIISYACRKYALEKALKIPNIRSEAGVQEYLIALLEKLEKDQEMISDKYTSDEGKLTKEKQASVVKSFALDVFKRADEEYRQGLADKNTALSFYSAAAFLEVADPTDEKLQKIRMAAKFNANAIMTAINEGREPLPPNFKKDESPSPAEGEEDENEGGEGDDDEGAFSNIPGLSSLNTGLPPAPVSSSYVPPSFHALPINARLSFKGREQFLHSSNNKPTPGVISGSTTETIEAEGYTRKAVDYFKKDDYLGGTEILCQALQVLEKRTPKPRLPKNGISEAAKLDVIEYLLFAARTLECAGELLSVQDAKSRAADLLSNALQCMESS